MNQLRLSFLLSIGGSVAVGDQFSVGSSMFYVDSMNVNSLNSRDPMNEKRMITSFGVRGANNPHDYDSDIKIHTSTDLLPASKVDWDLIVAWKYDLESLVKAQDKHDEKQKWVDIAEKNKARLSGAAEKIKSELPTIDMSSIPLHVSKEDQASQSLLNAVVESGRSAAQLKEAMNMKEKLVYTPEMKSINATPEVDMLCRIEYFCASRNDRVVDTITFKFESEKEYCGVDEKGFCFGIDKEDWISWHCIDDKNKFSEQIKGIVNDCAEGGFNDREKFTVAELITFLQWRDWIVKPLEK